MNATPATDPGTGTDPSAATDPGPSSATDTDAATEPSTATDTPTTGPDPTGDPTGDPTEDPTEDPTAGVDGQFCQESCMQDSDCTSMGADIGLTCQDNRCTSDAGKCDSDAACQALFSGWITTCASDGECLMGQLCIDIGGGAGRCANPPSPQVSCMQLMQEEIMVPPIGGGADVAVCANTSFECNDQGFCENPCEANTDCAVIPGHPQCNVGTGACECTADTDCSGTGQAGYAVCIEGRCGCGTDEDCAEVPNADVCNNGSCGCSDVSVCETQSLDGTTPVCEGF